MAAIYDPQGNYIGDDGAPDLDQMKLELVKKNQPLSSQIPGYGRPVPPSQTPPDPLGSAAGNFTELATKFNPLMMAKSMREAAGIITVPAVAAVKGVGESLTTSPAGTFTSGKAPAYAEKVATQFMQQNAPQTPMAQEFAGAIAPYMAELPAYLGHLQTGRPAFTPNDLRVMGAEATRVGRQVKDIPTDFYNAQSGLQKLDPITGQPTYGAKLQGVADSIGDIMAQREMQGLPPIPGLPASMQPTNPKLYAMRPEGSRVTSATLPATAKQDAATYTPARDLVRSVISDATMTPVQALDEIQHNILGKPESASARRAFESFLKTKANEMYPDAPSEGAALAAYKARFGDREASAAHSLEMYDEFLNTPKGMQYKAELDLPSAEELPAMHEAAANWLNSQFTNYIIEKVGTPNEPAAKLASQGLTFVPPSDVFDLSTGFSHGIEDKRIAAGMPAKTPTDEAVIAADQQLLELVQQAADAATRKREQEAIAQQLGYGAVDPNTGVVPEGMNLGRYEPFAQASRESDKANAAYRKQQKVVDNLRLGAAYEYATDTAISADTAKGLKEDLEYGERQFYPALMRTPDEERVYTASPSRLRELGFGDLAKSFYNDVMSRKIKLDKVPKMTVEKYIRDTAEGRIAKEKLAQAKEKQFKIDADNQFARSAALYIPNDKVFGNVGALEISDRFTPTQVAQLVSEDTLALDVCIGEGGNVKNKPNPWHPGTGDRQYIPIYDIVTGQRNPDATSPRGTYINAVANGSQMVSFRDVVTGEPVAIFDFNPSSSGKYDINFASGRKNGAVKTEYVEGIKSYLNSREDRIRGVSNKMNENLGIYDSKRMSNSALAAVVNTPVTTFKKYDLSGLPRFVTSSDIRNYVEELKANAPQELAPAILSQRPSESLEVSTAGAVASSIDNILDSQRLAFDEAGESNQFVQAEVFFRDTLDHFNRYLQAEGPVRALDRATQRLYDLENEYSNSPRIVANIIADGILDLMQNLGLQAEYVNARIAAEGAQPRAVAMQGDPMPNMDTEELLEQYRDRLSPEQVDWLQDFSERWEADVDDSPAGLGIHQVMVEEFARWRDANRLAPAAPVGQNGRPQYLRMTHDAFMQLENDFGTEAANEMRSAVRSIIEQQGIDPQISTDPFITALRVAAHASPLGTVDIALSNLANEMESAYMRDWEPEVAPQPPARQPQAFDFENYVDTAADELRILSETIARRYASIARGVAAQHSPRVDPVGYATALRAASRDVADATIGRELRRLADQVEATAPPAQAVQAPVAQVAPQFDWVGAVDNASNSIAINFGPVIADRFDTIAHRVAENHNPRLDPSGYADALRAVNPELEHEAVIRELEGLANRIELHTQPPVPRAADLDNMRNDRMIQAEDMLNDPELNPEDLRATAFAMSGMGNQHWSPLAEADRRSLSNQLYQRANYIEFNPTDFAAQLANEAGLNIADLRDTVQALYNTEFDHEVLRGLPDYEVGRAAHLTAVALERLLPTLEAAQGMQADAQLRALNPNGVPPAPAMRRFEVGDFNLFVNYLRENAPAPTARDVGHISETIADGIGFPDVDEALREQPAAFATRLNEAAEIETNPTTAQALRDLANMVDLIAPPITQIRPDRPITNQGNVTQISPAQLDVLYNNYVRDYQRLLDEGEITETWTPAELADFIRGDDEIGTHNPTQADREALAQLVETRGLPEALARNAEYSATAEEIVNLLEDGYYTDTPNPRAAVRLIRQHLRALNRSGEQAFEDILGMATTGYEWSPELMQALKVKLEALVARYQGMDDYAEGGPVRGYQAGGSVKKPDVPTPWLFSVPTYSETVAYEMYPGQKGQDDQRDAARHMLAAGTLSRKYGPKTAEFLGKAHEFTTSPLQAVKSMFGGQMPADYGMDTHNNRFGAELGQRAKSQAELEDLVQAEAERASRTQTQGQAFIKKANGGIVQQNPTTDQMRYALTMRRK